MLIGSAEDIAILPATTHRARGRSCQAKTKTQAERAKAYRERLKAEGLKEVKCFLSPEHLAYLRGLCDIHGGTIADAVALALTAAIRGEVPTMLPANKSPSQQSLILLSSG